MRALVEIMHGMPQQGRAVDTGRECIQPKWWDQRHGRTFLRGLHGNVNEWTDITDRITGALPKFALIPIEGARSLNAFSEQAQCLIQRNVNLYACLAQWVMGHATLVEALRGACWANMESIAKMQELAPFWCEPLSLEAETIEEWMGRVAECVLANRDMMDRASQWLNLQNPKPIEVNGVTYVYTPRVDLEARRVAELAKIRMMP